MTIDQIMAIIVAAAPSLTAIIGIIAAVVKMVKEGKISNAEVMAKFEETRKAVLDTQQYDELKKQLEIVHAENIELKKKINELLTLMDNVVRKED